MIIKFDVFEGLSDKMTPKELNTGQKEFLVAFNQCVDFGFEIVDDEYYIEKGAYIFSIISPFDENFWVSVFYYNEENFTDDDKGFYGENPDKWEVAIAPDISKGSEKTIELKEQNWDYIFKQILKKIFGDVNLKKELQTSFKNISKLKTSLEKEEKIVKMINKVKNENI